MKRRRNVLKKRLNETAAMLMVGDGILAVLEPRRHVKLWADGPELWRATMRPFVKRPGMTRVLGAVELGLGVWLASRQRP